MIMWVESHPTPAIAFMMFGFWYVVALLLLAVTTYFSNRPIAADLRLVTPVLLTPLAVITGLLIAFLSARVWANLDHADADVAQEANGLHEAALFADLLPADTRDAVHASIRRYLHFVDAKDWPAMAEGRASLQPVPPPLVEAMRTLFAFVPAGPNQVLAQERAIAAIDTVVSARRERVLLSQPVVAPLQWAVIVILGVLLLLTLALVHIDQRRTAATGIFILATALAACLLLLAVNDRPFASGGNTIEPAFLHQLGLD
ncbi:MAG TPA: hypothetical protein VMA37_14905 [Acetobacteraceae bacterium]|nr:hypothetical protein [Acetobacteraceae bacterium]